MGQADDLLEGLLFFLEVRKGGMGLEDLLKITKV